MIAVGGWCCYTQLSGEKSRRGEVVAESGGIGCERGLMGCSIRCRDCYWIRWVYRTVRYCNSRSTHSPQLWLETRATLKLAPGDE